MASTRSALVPTRLASPTTRSVVLSHLLLGLLVSIPLVLICYHCGPDLLRPQVAEIKNGRLAMIGVGGMVHQVRFFAVCTVYAPRYDSQPPETFFAQNFGHATLFLLILICAHPTQAILTKSGPITQIAEQNFVPKAFSQF